MYTLSLCGETIYKWPMDLVFMSTFNEQSISIGCVGKLGHLSGFLRHYLLTSLGSNLARVMVLFNQESAHKMAKQTDKKMDSTKHISLIHRG